MHFAFDSQVIEFIISLYTLVIKPISAEARLELNMKPELDNFSLPKVFLSVTFDEIEIRLSKLQVSLWIFCITYTTCLSHEKEIMR